MKYILTTWRSAPYARDAISRLLLVTCGLLVALGLTTLADPLKSGLRMTCYDNPEWTGMPTLRAIDRNVTLQRLQTLRTNLPEQYSILWTGGIFIPASGMYHFTTASDDGSELFLDGQIVVENGGAHGLQERSGSIHLERGFHQIEIRYMEMGGVALFDAFWTAPGETRQPLSQARLVQTLPGSRMVWLSRALSIFSTSCKILLGICVAALLALSLYHQHIRDPFLQHLAIFSLIFAVVLSIHFFGSAIATSYDSRWSIHVATSILREGNVDLDEYRALVEANNYYAAIPGESHITPWQPIGGPLLAVPSLWFLDLFLDKLIELDIAKIVAADATVNIEMCIASTIVALTSIFIYVIGRLRRLRPHEALLLTGIFAFGTSAWSTASRALWQHGPSMLMLSITLTLFLAATRPPEQASRLLQLAGVPLALSYVMRPTNSLSILVLTGYVLLRHRKHFLGFCCSAALVAIPFILFNLRVYGAILSPYYSPESLGLRPGFLKGLAAILVSPSRGLFSFSPILLFALYGIWLLWKRQQASGLDYALAIIIVLHWLTLPGHCWWGGHSYGPRLFSDMLPYLIYFLIPAIMGLSGRYSAEKVAYRAVFTLCLIVSILIHYRGTVSQAVYDWNALPVNIDQQPSRAWSLSDIQFLRGLGDGSAD